jgi:hypothetical protein
MSRRGKRRTSGLVGTINNGLILLVGRLESRFIFKDEARSISFVPLTVVFSGNFLSQCFKQSNLSPQAKCLFLAVSSLPSRELASLSNKVQYSG